MYQNRLENIVQIIEVQNTKLLESKQKEFPEHKEKIIDYEDADFYDYDEDLGICYIKDTTNTVPVYYGTDLTHQYNSNNI